MTTASDRHATRPVFQSGSILIAGSPRASMALDAPVHGAQDVRSWLESGTDIT
jgi:hypothetical protein